MTHPGLRLIRPMVKVASTIAPNLTGKAAFRLFSHVPQASRSGVKQNERTRQSEKRLAEAKIQKVKFDFGFVMIYRFETESIVQPQHRILLIHGWLSKAANMTDFVDPLLAQGYSVILVDLPGHGRSSGKTFHLPLAVEALTAVHAITGPWYGLVAHSLGGSVATTMVSGGVASSPALSVDRLVLISSPDSVPGIFKMFGEAIGLNSTAQAALEAVVLKLAGRPLESFTGLQQLRSAAIDTLILHAPDDKEVPYADAITLAEAGTFVRLQPVKGAGHRRIIYSEQAITATVDFFENT